MKEKAKVSIEWLSGCSGCEVGIVDLHEKLLNVLEEVELVRVPILMDTKEYVNAHVGIITGCVRTEHDIDAAKSMRDTCDAIIAFGTCPVYGGPQSAAYAHTNQELLDTAYYRNPTTSTSGGPTNVPRLLEESRPLDEIIEVDLYLPGCPPHPAYILEGLMSLLRSKSPTFGRHSVCFNCTRTMKKTDVAEIRRMTDGIADAQTCFLSQGYLCFGSVTLDRCLAPCPSKGTPCFSCGGPAESVILEPQKDVRSEVAARMSHLTNIPYEDVVNTIESQAKTHFAYAMASPVFRQKPTFLLKKWMQNKPPAKKEFAWGEH
ncbi:MAG: methyl viologen-reducing hydrogenase [Chitinivibrionales bacterium]|nr:methyl viologen-reducing hydrogenase [Chitinivibrionales bacterium]